MMAAQRSGRAPLRRCLLGRFGVAPRLFLLSFRGISSVSPNAAQSLLQEQPHVTVCMVGRPNVGKSSLFNRLQSNNRNAENSRQKAIVYTAAGTTRDGKSAMCQLGRLKMKLHDTPGLEDDSLTENSQVATFSFRKRTATLAGQAPISCEDIFELKLYSQGTVKSLKRFGSLEIWKLPKCFRIEPRSEASEFVSKFYTSLSLRLPSLLYSQLIFCQTELGLIVGIGANRDKHGSWISSDYGFKLELQSANVREIAALPKDSLEGPPRAGFEATPPKRPRRAEEASVGMDHHLASSFPDAEGFQIQYNGMSNSANDAALPLLEGLKAVNSPPPELNTGAHSDDELLEFVLESLGEYHAPLPIGSTTDPLNGGSGREYSGEASSGIIDGLYETANETGFDQLKMLSVNIRTEQTDHPRVELVVDFQHYEVRLCEESAVWREGCLQLDFSKEALDPETIIFRDALKLDYVSFASFRICHKEGGELVLMFDTSGYSEGSAQRDLLWKLKNPFSPACSGEDRGS
ncbi:hypothetical protein FOZ60_001103 [Perkinsus olseni]|uniref:G domain-containing protein n=1 Tax=Perkinsus olseni TaxID=32597 RepID=A0A7J6P3F2_PEROL|nr:hypothetical protein FOZ60_001103 [Perkinsus olseni]